MRPLFPSHFHPLSPVKLRCEILRSRQRPADKAPRRTWTREGSARLTADMLCLPSTHECMTAGLMDLPPLSFPTYLAFSLPLPVLELSPTTAPSNQINTTNNHHQQLCTTRHSATPTSPSLTPFQTRRVQKTGAGCSCGGWRVAGPTGRGRHSTQNAHAGMNATVHWPNILRVSAQTRPQALAIKQW